VPSPSNSVTIKQHIVVALVEEALLATIGQLGDDVE
jgi:hypothetical protein